MTSALATPLMWVRLGVIAMLLPIFQTCIPMWILENGVDITAMPTMSMEYGALNTTSLKGTSTPWLWFCIVVMVPWIPAAPPVNGMNVTEEDVEPMLSMSITTWCVPMRVVPLTLTSPSLFPIIKQEVLSMPGLNRREEQSTSMPVMMMHTFPTWPNNLLVELFSLHLCGVSFV